MSILGFLQQREYGSKKFTNNKKAVKTWLGKLASTPCSNQPCEFSGEPRATFLVDFSPNRTKVASTHGDHTVRVTDIATGKCTHILTGHPRTPWCLAFHPASNDILASGCLGGEVRIWDLSGGGSEVWKSDNNAVISSLTFHPFDHVLVFATSNTVYFWDWSQPQPFTYCRTTYDYERVRWVRFDTFGHYFFTGICNNTTVHRRPTTNVVHISDDTGQGGSGGGLNPNWRQMQVNRQRYQALVQRFFHYQQERLQLNSRPRGSSAWGEEEGEGERPTSPMHVAALNEARDYASMVTTHSRDRAQIGERFPRQGLSRSVPGEYSLYGASRPGTHSPPPRRLDDDGTDHDQPVRQSDDMDRLASELGPGWRITPAPSSQHTQGSSTSHPAPVPPVTNPLPGSNLPQTPSQASSASQLSFMRSTLHRLGVDGSQPPPAGDTLFNVATEVAMSGWQSTGSERLWPPVTTRSGTVSAAGSMFAGSYQPFSSAASTAPNVTTVSQSAESDRRSDDSISAQTHMLIDRGTESSLPNQQRNLNQAVRGGGNTVPSSIQNAFTSGAVNGGVSSTPMYSHAQGVWDGASQATNAAQSQSAFSSGASVAPAQSLASDVNTGTQPAPKRSYSTAFGAAQPNPSATSAMDSVSQRSEGIHWLTGAAPTDSRPTDRAVGSQRTALSRRVTRGRGRLALMLSEGAATSRSAQGCSSCQSTSQSHLRSCLTRPGNNAGASLGSRDSAVSRDCAHTESSSTNQQNSSSHSRRRVVGGHPRSVHPPVDSTCEHSDANDGGCPICVNFNLDLLQPRRPLPIRNPSCLRALQQATGAYHPRHRRIDHPVLLVPTADGGLAVPPENRLPVPPEGELAAASPVEQPDDPPSDALSARVLRFPSSHRTHTGGGLRTQTADGTSQTQGDLNTPELADQGTDVVGLGQPPRQGSGDEEGEDAEMNEEFLSTEDHEMVETEPEGTMCVSTHPCTCGHALDPSPMSSTREQSTTTSAILSETSTHAPVNRPVKSVCTQGHGNSSLGHEHLSLEHADLSHGQGSSSLGQTNSSTGHEHISQSEVHSQRDVPSVGVSESSGSVATSLVTSAGSERRQGPMSGLTEHLEQQVSELDRRINVLRDTFNERMRALNEDRMRLLSSLRSRMLRDPSSQEHLPTLAELQSRMLAAEAESGNRDLISGQLQAGSLHLGQESAGQTAAGSLDFGMPRPSDLMSRLSSVSQSQSRSGLGAASLLRNQLSNMATSSSSASSSSTSSHSNTSRTFSSILLSGLSQPPTSGIGSDIFNSTRDSIPSGLAPGSRPVSTWSQGSGSGSSFGSRSGSRNMIEVLGPSGESETITYRELARRMANREDVMVVGDHRLRTPAAASNSQGGEHSAQHPLLETFLRADHPPNPPRRPSHHRALPTIRVDHSASQDGPFHESMDGGASSRMLHEDHRWHALQQRHLHPHYSVSILDETINRPNDALQTAINRAIAGVFMSSGEQAVASNIVPQTHRVQRWDFRQCQIPDLTQSKANIVVEHCKLHNDASIDISQDATFLATFVPSHRGFPDDNILAVFSLLPESFGQCLYTKSFGPNAISVSLSPENCYILVGLAAKRLSWVFTPNQLVGQIYKMKEQGAGEMSMKHVTDVLHPCVNEGRPHVSVNSARWLPEIGDGIVYGTNRGDLHFYRTGPPKMAAEDEKEDSKRSRRSGQLYLRPQQVSSIATQTGTGSIHRTAFTQTSEGEGTN